MIWKSLVVTHTLFCSVLKQIRGLHGCYIPLGVTVWPFDGDDTIFFYTCIERETIGVRFLCSYCKAIGNINISMLWHALCSVLTKDVEPFEVMHV